jgi:hypothetical protein
MVTIPVFGEFLSLDIRKFGLGIAYIAFLSTPESDWESGSSGVAPDARIRKSYH